MDEERPNVKKSPNLILAFVGLALIIVVGGFLYVYKFSKNEVKEVREEKPVVVASKVPMQKFLDTEDGKSAYKIFPGDLNADAKKALIGFDMQTKNLPDGSTAVTLVAKKQGYITQTLTVKQGQSLYFIEKFSLDDNAAEDTDSGMKDDKGVVVDVNGYEVK
jgi:hypothetical protein